MRGWDPATKQEIVGTANGEQPASSIGIQFNSVKSAFPEQRRRPDRQRAGDHRRPRRRPIAKSVLAKLRDAWLDAEGEAAGDPKLRAGAKVTIKGVGSDYSGDYVLTSTTHIVAAERGYHVRFRDQRPHAAHAARPRHADARHAVGQRPGHRRRDQQQGPDEGWAACA